MSNTMNTNAAYRLILSFDITFIFLCFQTNVCDIWSTNIEFMR